MYGNSDKIYLPCFDREQVIVVSSPLLKSYDLNMSNNFNECLDIMGNWYKSPGLRDTTLSLEYSVRDVSVMECKNVKDLFQSLSDDLTVKEVLQIVQDKLTKRENKNGN